jgi:predicted nucleotidyltransferase
MFNFYSKTTEKILSYFFNNPKEKRYVRELALKLSLDPSNLSKKLKELALEGILNSEAKSKELYYNLNLHYPFIKELKAVFNSRFGVEEQARAALKNLKNLKKAYIFGSYAAGKFSSESDVDLLLIGDHSALEAQKALLPLQHNLGREINIIDLTESDLLRLKKKKDEFILNIFANKIIELV